MASQTNKGIDRETDNIIVSIANYNPCSTNTKIKDQNHTVTLFLDTTSMELTISSLRLCLLTITEAIGCVSRNERITDLTLKVSF